MKLLTTIAAVLGITLVVMGSPVGTPLAFDGGDRSPALATSGPAATTSVISEYQGPAAELENDALNAVIQRACVYCHNDAALTGGLSLQHFDVSKADADPAIAEKMVRKLRAGMMPPSIAIVHPRADTMLALVENIERVLDRAAARSPNPGSRVFQRLNRPEYEYAIRELLGINVNAELWLPLDTKSAGFDNVADVQGLSPLLLESYMNAAAEISLMAVGNRNAQPTKHTYTNSDYVSQHPWDHVPGAPYGTRGGMVVEHVFPADGYYTFTMTFTVGGNTRLEDIDLSIDGEQAALFHYESGVFVQNTSADARDAGGGLVTDPIFVRAGQHRISAAFVRQAEGPYEDLIRPHEWALAGLGQGSGGVTILPHMRDFIVAGPTAVTGLSETPSRQKIFSCRPTATAEQEACARQIITRIGSEAYRRSLNNDDMEGLMTFYQMGVEKDGFEGGVRMALEAILASPNFYFRLESQPANARDGRSYALSDLELANRLSFFLWGTPPDEELRDLATRGRLTSGRNLELQARRMLADPRSEALGTRFAAQWLNLQDLYKVRPDPNFFPNYDQNLADAMHRETELFFYEFVKNDMNMLDMFTADFTFVNDRLARHYGFPNVAGSHFRRIDYPDATRQGLLGQGSLLVLTSLANRTSPVLRGKWVMGVLMGTPPPPPPPNVPVLEQTGSAAGGKMLTTRQRMEIHRDNDACRSCHRMMDPIGLALDNFDVTGKFRYRENGAELDTRGEFYDGTPISSLADLNGVLVKRPIPLVRAFTSNLLTYALGRRLEDYDQPLVRAIAKEAEASDYRVSSFIMGVIKSDAFQMRRADVAQANDGR